MDSTAPGLLSEPLSKLQLCFRELHQLLDTVLLPLGLLVIPRVQLFKLVPEISLGTSWLLFLAQWQSVSGSWFRVGTLELRQTS